MVIVVSSSGATIGDSFSESGIDCCCASVERMSRSWGAGVASGVGLATVEGRSIVEGRLDGFSRWSGIARWGHGV